MKLFNMMCRHKWKVVEKSNVIQLDDMGYPLRLFICKCEKCGKYDQQWIDVSEEVFLDKNIKILNWEKVE